MTIIKMCLAKTVENRYLTKQVSFKKNVVGWRITLERMKCLHPLQRFAAIPVQKVNSIEFGNNKTVSLKTLFAHKFMNFVCSKKWYLIKLIVIGPGIDSIKMIKIFCMYTMSYMHFYRNILYYKTKQKTIQVHVMYTCHVHWSRRNFKKWKRFYIYKL